MSETVNMMISDVIEAFRHRTFEFIGKADDGWFRLHGKLVPSNAAESCACEIKLDPECFDLPQVRLLEIPSGLPPIVPHLGPSGYLCYLAKGTVVLDIFDPIGQSLACLDRAEYVFDKILKNEMIDDLEEEFHAYWGDHCCFVDVQSKNLGRQDSLIIRPGNNVIAVVSDDVDRTTKKLQSLGHDVIDSVIQTYRVRTTEKPRPSTQTWPPKTVRDILAWQSKLDSKCRRKIEQRIEQAHKNHASGVLILIESPLMTYGFMVFYKRDDETKKGKPLKRKSAIYGLDIYQMSVVRIDDRYLAERNTPSMKNLSGKNITLVGCGTIGGFLSEMLLKAGAGTCGGQLTLVDPDTLYPSNIGRHRLGFPHLFSKKAAGMAEELRRLAPGINVRPLPVDIRQAKLGKLDLLIDATGEEALGHWLCQHYLQDTPMLSVWIEGAGIAVRALIRINNSGACYRCLYESNRKELLKTVVGYLPTVLAGQGCEGLYVPFPASVSVQAASLGAEMALNWANNVYSPALRTKLIDQNYQLATPDCDPPRNMDCPACPT